MNNEYDKTLDTQLLMFSINNHKYYMQMFKTIEKYKDDAYCYGCVSKTYKNLLRLMAERNWEPYKISEEDYYLMKCDVEELKNLDYNAFYKFSQIIRDYVKWQKDSMGYTTFVEHIYRVNKTRNFLCEEEGFELLKKLIKERSL